MPSKSALRAWAPLVPQLVRIIQSRASELAVTCGRRIEIVAVTARRSYRDRGVDLTGIEWFGEPGGSGAEGRYRRFRRTDRRLERGGQRRRASQPLRRGLHVVTANKALLAYHGVELAEDCRGEGALLNFEAAVAGGIPVIKALRRSLTGNTISRVYGIMNGTCNYILTGWRRRACPSPIA